jgi:hypothetical protein
MFVACPKGGGRAIDRMTIDIHVHEARPWPIAAKKTSPAMGDFQNNNSNLIRRFQLDQSGSHH